MEISLWLYSWPPQRLVGLLLLSGGGKPRHSEAQWQQVWVLEGWLEVGILQQMMWKLIRPHYIVSMAATWCSVLGQLTRAGMYPALLFSIWSLSLWLWLSGVWSPLGPYQSCECCMARLVCYIWQAVTKYSIILAEKLMKTRDARIMLCHIVFKLQMLPRCCEMSICCIWCIYNIWRISDVYLIHIRGQFRVYQRYIRGVIVLVQVIIVIRDLYFVALALQRLWKLDLHNDRGIRFHSWNL